MNILLLGYGKEGKSTESYFKSHFANSKIDILTNFTLEEIQNKDFSSYDLVFRSPSVPPLHLANETSVTKYFFDHCPCPIIGVTATKGKGTMCSLIHALLLSLGIDSRLVGNIGIPSIDVLDDLTSNSVVVYEMSSFQLWDLEKSPHIAIIGRLEADHLNVHYSFEDYLNAKSHIAAYQNADDTVIYFKNNEHSIAAAEKSAGTKIPYPLENPPEKLIDLLSKLAIPGDHNKENAEAALLAVSAYLKTPLENLIKENFSTFRKAFENFKGLPHHIEFVRELNNVKYYDDSFSASYPSLDVALKAFADKKVVLIAGGKDRGLDLKPMKDTIFGANNLVKVILIGETKSKLAKNENPEKYITADTLDEAVNLARTVAESNGDIVLLSPGAASFDMFKDFYDRGEKFQTLVKELK